MAMVGEGEQTIVNDLQELDIELFIEREKNEVVAVMGYEYDDALQRGFLYGPWAIEERWDELADELFDRVLPEPAVSDRDIELAFNIRNERAQRFSDRHGFELVRDHFFMAYPRERATVAPDDAIRPMADEDRDAVMALHERCFPGQWPSARQLLEQLDKGPDRTIFVLHVGRLAGYHYARVDRSTGEASVENIGVDDAFRGRGFATRLLSHGLWWMFSFEEVTGIELSVRAENVEALRVYEKAGFQKKHSIRQTRKPLEQPA